MAAEIHAAVTETGDSGLVNPYVGDWDEVERYLKRRIPDRKPRASGTAVPQAIKAAAKPKRKRPQKG